MARRYLTSSEAISALARGRAIEAWVGTAEVLNQPVVRWLSLRATNGKFYAELWESCDVGSEDFLDIYEFGTPDGDNEPSVVYTFDTADQCLRELESQYPGVSARLVNSGVIQDEYADHLRSTKT